jgi:hypothetical protein
MIVILLMLAALVALQVFRQARAANLDWTGIAFSVGFVVLAFYLRHVTEIG